MPKIRVHGGGGLRAEAESSPARSLLNSLLASGFPIKHECGGKALCGTCAVRILGGAAGLSPVSASEAGRLAAVGRPADYRLACQARTVRDVDIELPSE